MPNIENLKKQAKALVRLHADHSYHLACVARDVLPKFAALTDREVLAAEFKLSDAQELLARQQGCTSWVDLKARLEAEAQVPPKPKPSPERPGLVYAQPMLYVADLKPSIDYYERRLGFEQQMIAGEPPFYAEVGRDDVVLSLRRVRGHAIDPEVRAREAIFIQANIRVANAKALFLEFVAAGADIHTPLRREPWGAWFFAVKDVDENLIGFGEAAPQGE